MSCPDAHVYRLLSVQTCPCGSKKKYKKCCKTDTTGTLTSSTTTPTTNSDLNQKPIMLSLMVEVLSKGSPFVTLEHRHIMFVKVDPKNVDASLQTTMESIMKEKLQHIEAHLRSNEDLEPQDTVRKISAKWTILENQSQVKIGLTKHISPLYK